MCGVEVVEGGLWSGGCGGRSVGVEVVEGDLWSRDCRGNLWEGGLWSKGLWSRFIQLFWENMSHEGGDMADRALGL